jgi:uncharacterized iron-regulated membrane protein
LLVVDDSNVYGYGRRLEYYKWTTPMEYHLFAADRKPEIVRPAARKRAAQPAARKQNQQQKKQRSNPATTRPSYHWSRQSPIYVRAMVLADKTIFIAGPQDIIDEEQIFKNPDAPGIDRKLRQQIAALDGKMGALLRVVSASDGKELAQYKLETIPVWDGMAAANGRLYLSMKNGRVQCFEGK